LTDDQLYGASKMTEDPYWKTTPRLNFQLVGTELMRKQFPKLVMDEMRRLRFKTDLSDAERATIASFQENATKHIERYLKDALLCTFFHLQSEDTTERDEKNINAFAEDMYKECMRYIREEFPLRAMSIMRPDLEPVDNIGENFWIKRINKNYIDLTEDESMCIADGRFPNETKFGKDNGGICFRISRPGTTKMEHDSERFIIEIKASGARSKWNANECILANTLTEVRKDAVGVVYDLLKDQGLI
jgi:hypothetical protein